MRQRHLAESKIVFGDIAFMKRIVPDRYRWVKSHRQNSVTGNPVQDSKGNVI